MARTPLVSLDKGMLGNIRHLITDLPVVPEIDNEQKDHCDKGKGEHDQGCSPEHLCSSVAHSRRLDGLAGPGDRPGPVGCPGCRGRCHHGNIPGG
jgi:hypothetical protein